ncbi:hypothetical protein C8R47DRAFT_987115 [Mycena vitilis]|nr:hypothetical protein C8R47DRAFT_987115 [Mycena vitilis]
MPGVSAHPLGATAAAIVRDDLSRLSPGRYLNDSIIEVGLNLWLIELEQTNPALAESIHIFTPFFIKKLDPGNGTDIW